MILDLEHNPHLLDACPLASLKKLWKIKLLDIYFNQSIDML